MHAACLFGLSHCYEEAIAAKPLAAGHLQQNRTLAAKPIAATMRSNHLHRKRPLAAR